MKIAACLCAALAAGLVVATGVATMPQRGEVRIRFNLPHCHRLADRSVECRLRPLPKESQE